MEPHPTPADRARYIEAAKRYLAEFHAKPNPTPEELDDAKDVALELVLEGLFADGAPPAPERGGVGPQQA